MHGTDAVPTAETSCIFSALPRRSKCRLLQGHQPSWAPDVAAIMPRSRRPTLAQAAQQNRGVLCPAECKWACDAALLGEFLLLGYRAKQVRVNMGHPPRRSALWPPHHHHATPSRTTTPALAQPRPRRCALASHTYAVNAPRCRSGQRWRQARSLRWAGQVTAARIRHTGTRPLLQATYRGWRRATARKIARTACSTPLQLVPCWLGEPPWRSGCTRGAPRRQ